MAKVIGSNDFMTIAEVNEFKNMKNTEIVRHNFIPDQRGEMVADLLRAWGMVAGFRGNEDSSGRTGLELMPVCDVIDRAFDMTDQAYKEMDKRGWLVKIDRTEEVEDEAK